MNDESNGHVPQVSITPPPVKEGAATEIAAPVAKPDRVTSIDVLRGFALLGILVMNIWGFAMPFAAYANPNVYGGTNGLDWAAYVFSHLFFDQKMMSIFSMLFGAGVLLMTSRAEQRTGRSADLHYRRMGWLLLFGLAHGFLIWWGDILVLYAICGCLVYLLRKLKPLMLVIIAIPLLVPPMLFNAGQGGFILFMETQLEQPDLDPKDRSDFEDDIAEMSAFWEPPQEDIDHEIEAMTGTYGKELAFRAPFLAEGYLFYIPLWGIWRAGGMMLLGMALYKWGVLSARRPTGFYARLAAVGLLIGLLLVLTGYLLNERADWEQVPAMLVNSHFNYVGSVLVAVGYIGVIMLWCRSTWLPPLKRSLAAVGQMALTNYLMHSVVCSTIFNGRGFGLFGELGRSEQLLVVAGVWIFQLIVSPIWLSYFRFGPAEWLWRTLTYWKPQPMVRRG